MSHRAREIQGKAADYARILRENLPGLRERYGVVSLGIFGSFVRGEEREDSDLDVLVDYSRLPDLFNFVAMKLELSDLLGVKVDLVMKKGLKPRVGKQILADLVLV